MRLQIIVSTQYQCIFDILFYIKKNLNSLLIYKADIYSEEIKNYSSYTEDSQSYYGQILEEDAYKYAEEQVKVYLEGIGE